MSAPPVEQLSVEPQHGSLYQSAYAASYPTVGPGPYLDPYSGPVPNPYGYPGHYPPPLPTSIRGLAIALRILLILSALVSVIQAYAWWHEYVLIGDLQVDPRSVTLTQGRAADGLVGSASLLWVLLFLAVIVVFLVWFYRVRQNAGNYGTGRQRHSQGWSIGAWFCPIISLFYPYQMTVDVLTASESEADSAPRPLRSVALVNLWWSVWILSTVLYLVRLTFGSQTLNEQRSRDSISILLSVTEAIAALLLMLVIARISAAQQRRQPGWR